MATAGSSRGGQDPACGGAPFARVGLDLLFSISGFLAIGSWQRQPVWGPFLARRATRPLSGLIPAVLLTVFIIGPIATTLSLRHYFLNGTTIKYFANIYLHPELFLPGVFHGRQWNAAVNPMLWTIKLGLLCCIALPFLMRIATTAACAALSAAAYLALVAVWPEAQISVLSMNIRDISAELPFFFVGATLGLLADRRIWRADLAMLLFAANWTSAAWIGAWNIMLEWLTLPYMAICFGRMAMPGLGRLRRGVGNPSYGLYLYAFPIQQLVLARWPGNPWPIVTCALLTLPVAILSWHLVERPALRWLEHGAPPWARTAA